MIVDCAVYVGGRRAVGPHSLRETHETCREQRGVAWIGLHEPTAEEFDSVAAEFELHPLAVEDAVKAHQRPKLEHYDEMLFAVLRTARYPDEAKTVDFGEVHVFAGQSFVVTVRHGETPALAEVREAMEGNPDLLGRGTMAILYAIMDRVVDDYLPVVEGLENDIEEIEQEVFEGNPGATRRIYELSREVIEFHKATKPLAGALERLMEDEGGAVDIEVRRHLRDVRDHLLRVVEQVEGFRELLNNILGVNLTLVSIGQNEEVKKISAWAATLFAPTLVAGVYGMNFERMPELAWHFGYPFALALMGLIAVVLHRVFRRSGWL